MLPRCKHCWHSHRAHLDREISDMVNHDPTMKWLPLVRSCRTLYTVDHKRCPCPGWESDSRRYKHRTRPHGTPEQQKSPCKWTS